MYIYTYIYATVDKSGTTCITLEVICTYIRAALMHSKKVGKLMIIICDPIALRFIFVSFQYFTSLKK